MVFSERELAIQAVFLCYPPELFVEHLLRPRGNSAHMRPLPLDFNVRVRIRAFPLLLLGEHEFVRILAAALTEQIHRCLASAVLKGLSRLLVHGKRVQCTSLIIDGGRWRIVERVIRGTFSVIAAI